MANAGSGSDALHRSPRFSPKTDDSPTPTIAEAMADAVREALLVLDGDLRVVAANRPFYETFGADPATTVGQVVHDLGDSPWRCRDVITLLEGRFPEDPTSRDCEVEHEVEHGDRRVLVFRARRLDEHPLILLTVEDVTQRVRADRALHESEQAARERLAEIEATYATAPVGLGVLDRELRFVRVNRRLAEMNGRSVEGHLGQTIREVVPDLADEAEPVLQAILDTGEPVVGVEISGETPAELGVARTWVESWFPLHDEAGAVVGINIVAEDVTEWRKGEQALRESEARFRAMADSAPVLVWTSGLDQGRTYVNEPWLQFTGRTLDQEVGEGWVDGIHPDDLGRCRATYARAFGAHAPFEMEYRLRRRDGAYRWLLDRGVPRSGSDGTFLGYVGSSVDIDARKRAEEAVRDLNATLEARVEARTREVRESEARVRKLARALTLAEEQERGRLALVLHDDLQQMLVGAQIAVALGDRERTEAVLSEAIQTTRTLSHRLSPTLLKGQGLADLLGWLAEMKRDLYGLDVEVDVHGNVEVPEEDLRVLLYRLLRELLFNVVKHAGTGRARVVVTRDAGTVRVVVEDEGAGFAPAAWDERGGLGLASVRERLELVGGRLTVDSAPGEGTRATLEVPSDARA